MSKSSITISSDPVTLNLPPIHPGEILVEELQELNLSANGLARALNIPANRISAILKGSRSITADTALRLARYFGTTPRFWLNLQMSYDLAITEQQRGADILDQVHLRGVEIAPSPRNLLLT